MKQSMYLTSTIRISFLFIVGVTIIIGCFSTSAFASEYDDLRTKWKDILVGGEQYDASDPDIAAANQRLDERAGEYWSTLNTSPDRTYLWSDLADRSNAGNITQSYNRIKSMALAYSTLGSEMEGNSDLLSDMISSLDWMYANLYNENKTWNSQWFQWELGTPMSLNDITVLLYDHLTPAQIDNYMTAIEKFTWDPTLRYWKGPPYLEMTGANRVWKSYVVAIRGIIVQDSTKIAMARDALSQLFVYAETKDGFYEDGSFIQHGSFPYNGGYGRSLIASMVNLMDLLADSTWEVTDPNSNFVFQWIYDSFEPFMYNGLVMDMVRGRGISGSSDHITGHTIISTVAQLAEFAPPADADRYKAVVKRWILNDNYRDYLSNATLPDIIRTKAILNDVSIKPRGELIGQYQMPAMARVVHRRPGYAFGLSMFSNQIRTHESIKEENLKGWYTGYGMTYLYKYDLGQYNDFWPTVDAYRLPGTTVDSTLPRTEGADGTLNPKVWTGGAQLDDLYGVSGMEFSTVGDFGLDKKLTTPSSLEGKKSWFMFDDEIVAVGSGINSSDNRTIETIIENRKLNDEGDNHLTINGKFQSTELGWEDSLKDVTWAHLEDNAFATHANPNENSAPHGGGQPQAAGAKGIGYYFPTPVKIEAKREARTGSWNDVRKGIEAPGSTDIITANYLTLWFDHGKNPINQTYVYTLLTDKTIPEVKKYASNPDISILENSNYAHAVRENTLNITAVNFWEDESYTSGGLTSDTKASVIMEETASEITIGVSDPTRMNNTEINIELNQSVANTLSLDSGIEVVQLSPTLKLKIHPNGSLGQTFHATFSKNSVTSIPVTPNFEYATTGVAQAHMAWYGIGDAVGYKIYYGTTSGSYSNVIDVGNVDEYSVKELLNDAAYYFTITAYNANGESLISEERSVTPVKSMTYYITPEMDGYVRAGIYSDVNYNNWNTMPVKTAGNPNDKREAFLRFDLPIIRDQITSAELKLTPVNVGSGRSDQQIALTYDNTWTESSLTWNNQPLSGESFNSWSPVSGQNSIIDVTQQVEEAVNDIGFHMYSNTGQHIAYATKENGGAANWPLLTIHVGEVIVDEPDDEPTKGPVRKTPIADSYVSELALDTNYGTEDKFIVKDYSGTQRRQAYLKFDVSDVTEVNSAVLRIYGVNTSKPTGVTTSVYGSASDVWEESGITWNNAPGSDESLIGTIEVDGTGKYVEIDLTDYVSDQVSGDGTVSLVLSNDTQMGEWLRFNSREGANPPELIIVEAKVKNPIADSYVSELALDTNYGTEDKFIVKDYSGTQRRQAYLKFDVSDVTKVNSAVLRLYGVNTSKPTGVTTSIYDLASDVWEESGITWNNAPRSDEILIGTIEVDGTGKYVEIDLTDYVSDQVSGDGTVSLALSNDTQTGEWLRFNSREGANPPELIIN